MLFVWLILMLIPWKGDDGYVFVFVVWLYLLVVWLLFGVLIEDWFGFNCRVSPNSKRLREWLSQRGVVN